MDIKSLLLTLVTLSCIFHGVYGVFTCLTCQGVVDPSDCDTISRCSADQKCFGTIYNTTIGAKRYRLGCRGSQQCTSPAPSGKRTLDGGSVILDECCSGDLCNAATGNFPGFRKPRGPICYNCPSQAGYNDCENIAVCGRNELCRLNPDLNHPGTFATSCENALVCSAISSVNGLGKRRFAAEDSSTVDIQDCFQCCDSDLCNDRCNHAPVHTSPCTSNPCVHGTCSDTVSTTTSTKYTCQCEYGYKGINCDTAIDWCNPNPCVHGQCNLHYVGYICSCEMGYVGQDCETLYDYCSPNRCVHGTCSSHSSGYTCTCSTGYAGTHCDAPFDHCASNPCVHGTCSSHSSGYTCTCSTGYAGTHCDTLFYRCAPNPCVHGTCSSQLSGYTCTCSAGYSGRRCETRVVTNECSSNPCIHGTCSGYNFSYKCTCNSGYYGRNCELQLATNECGSNPCVHGICSEDSAAYRCTCNYGYYGRNCELQFSKVTGGCGDKTSSASCNLAAAIVCVSRDTALKAECLHTCGYC